MSSPAAAGEAISTLLTVIITTSPTPSAPSTMLISSVLASFRRHCPGLTACPVIVVLDAFERVAPRPRLKKGCVTEEGARDYHAYKDNVKQLVLDEYCPPAPRPHPPLVQGRGSAEYGSPFMPKLAVGLSTARTEDGRVTFVEPAERLGFGLAVRSALRLAATPYVWVQQHDWPLVADIPLGPLLDVMRASDADDAAAPVRYVCMPSVRMLSYATSEHVARFPALRELTAALKRDFAVPGPGGAAVPLTPLFLWHDKPHLASTAHYLARVFPSRLALMRGAFIEDTVGHRARNQMKEGQFQKWACWLYYPNEGEQVCLRHLNGQKRRGMKKMAAQEAESQDSLTSDDVHTQTAKEDARIIDRV